MAECGSTDTKKEIAEGLKSILQRIADFFDIFDLSFIISGAVTLSGLAFWSWRAGLPMPPLPENWLYSMTLIIAAYVFGLLCFAVGRWLRMQWRFRRLEGGSDDRFLHLGAVSAPARRAARDFAEVSADGPERGRWGHTWAISTLESTRMARIKGTPKTGGRQRGMKNKRTTERERALAETAVKITEALGADAFDGDAHALLTAIYKDAAQPIGLRMDAAKAAIGYEKPRLAAVEGKVEGRMTLEQLVEASYRESGE